VPPTSVRPRHWSANSDTTRSNRSLFLMLHNTTRTPIPKCQSRSRLGEGGRRKNLMASVMNFFFLSGEMTADGNEGTANSSVAHSRNQLGRTLTNALSRRATGANSDRDSGPARPCQGSRAQYVVCCARRVVSRYVSCRAGCTVNKVWRRVLPCFCSRASLTAAACSFRSSLVTA